jgi:tRNA (guanine-N7-)-methyltransferase
MQTDRGVPMAAARDDGPADAGAAGQRQPRNFSVRSRHAALSAAQQQTWRRLWPQLGAEEPGTAGPLDTHDWFGRDAPVVLEIGSGAGTSTVAMARAEPDTDVIAVEVYRRGLAQLLCAIEQQNIDNIRLIRGHALDVLEHLIAPVSLTGVRVFFPDPWPKARHHKRRLLQPATFGLIAERLRPGGVLHAATDHAGYAEQIADAGDAEPRLRRTAPGPDMQALPISVVRPTTKYEAKARDGGRAVTELLWERL